MSKTYMFERPGNDTKLVINITDDNEAIIHAVKNHDSEIQTTRSVIVAEVLFKDMITRLSQDGYLNKENETDKKEHI